MDLQYGTQQKVRSLSFSLSLSLSSSLAYLGPGEQCASIGLGRVQQVVGNGHEADLRCYRLVVLQVVVQHLQALSALFGQPRLIHEDEAAGIHLISVGLRLSLDGLFEDGLDVVAAGAP